jgi:hypothetical protein
LQDCNAAAGTFVVTYSFHSLCTKDCWHSLVAFILHIPGPCIRLLPLLALLLLLLLLSVFAVLHSALLEGLALSPAPPTAAAAVSP